MMAEKEDLGLSLSLSVPQNQHSLQFNHMPSLQFNHMPSLVPSTAASSLPGFNPQKPSWNVTFPPSGMSFFLL